MARPKIPRAKKNPEYVSTPGQLKARRSYLKGKKQINLALPEGLADRVKSAAIISGVSLKDYIEEAIKMKMRSDGIMIEEEE